jgi:hypothetical protein
MQTSNFYEHANHMVLKLVCGFVLCVYVCKFAFKEEEEGNQFVFPDLGCELASSSRLVFVLHEASSECDSDWRLGLRKDEELCIYEGGRFYKGGIFLGFGSTGRRS